MGLGPWPVDVRPSERASQRASLLADGSRCMLVLLLDAFGCCVVVVARRWLVRAVHTRSAIVLRAGSHAFVLRALLFDVVPGCKPCLFARLTNEFAFVLVRVLACLVCACRSSWQRVQLPSCRSESELLPRHSGEQAVPRDHGRHCRCASHYRSVRRRLAPDDRRHPRHVVAARHRSVLLLDGVRLVLALDAELCARVPQGPSGPQARPWVVGVMKTTNRLMSAVAATAARAAAHVRIQIRSPPRCARFAPVRALHQCARCSSAYAA